MLKKKSFWSFFISFKFIHTSLLAHNKESISSMKMTEGCFIEAIANSVLTIFSPSPTHLLVSELAEIEKKVEFDSLAIAFPIHILVII